MKIWEFYRSFGIRGADFIVGEEYSRSVYFLLRFLLINNGSSFVFTMFVVAIFILVHLLIKTQPSFLDFPMRNCKIWDFI